MCFSGFVDMVPHDYIIMLIEFCLFAVDPANLVHVMYLRVVI